MSLPSHSAAHADIAGVHYTIQASQPGAHMFEVRCDIAAPDPAGQVLSLPAWIPGSYMIREFARNIVSLRAESAGQALAVTKLDKHTWQLAPVPAGQTVSVVYEVYAWDLSVRAAHLDPTHGFFNGTSVFLAVAGQDEHACTVDLLPPKGIAATWKVATALSPLSAQSIDAAGFGRYRASNYDELIDHPVEMGCWESISFVVAGVRHEVVLTGRHDCDFERLRADLQRICRWQIEFFGQPAPIQRYVFLTMVVGDGYGGLEHRASTALLVSRKDLPYVGMSGTPEGYVSLLGLFSHEYFHTWHVKRIKPAAFTPYRLAEENYTQLLWVFEGFTSYYDDLCLRRAGVISSEEYLRLVGKNISAVLRGSGRLKQSVAESSFDAWTKYYRQDENAPNAIVSYYAKGALVALCLDVKLRQLTSGKLSLDDVMRLLWQHHGQTGVGLGEQQIFSHVARLVDEVVPGKGAALATWLQHAVEGTDDLPLAELLQEMGVTYHSEAESTAPSLGVKHTTRAGECVVAQVFDGGPAQAAGVSAGDVLVALDGLRVPASGLDAMLARRRAGERVQLHVFRRDELMAFELTLADTATHTVRLSLATEITPAVADLRAAWLGEAVSVTE